VDGKISSVKGTCPNVTFDLKSYSVVANGATDYKRSSCKDLKNDRKVKVSGTLSGTTITASQIEVDK
jgi:hypothetical protein